MKYNRKKRTLYSLDNIDICLDRYPHIDPYFILEFECQTTNGLSFPDMRGQIEKVVGKIGLPLQELTTLSKSKLFAQVEENGTSMLG